MNTLAPSFLIQSSSFLQVTRTCMKAWMSSNFGHIPPQIQSYLPLHISCTSGKMMYNVVNTLAPTFSIRSSSFLQVRGQL